MVQPQPTGSAIIKDYKHLVLSLNKREVQRTLDVVEH